MFETFSMFIHCTVLLEFAVMYSSIQITMISVFGEFVMLIVVSVLLTCLESFVMLVIITLFFRH